MNNMKYNYVQQYLVSYNVLLLCIVILDNWAPEKIQLLLLIVSETLIEAIILCSERVYQTWASERFPKLVYWGDSYDGQPVWRWPK